MTDRMDCQTMMGIFTFIYYQTFLATKTLTFAAVVESVKMLSNVDKAKLLEYLQTLN
jgi:phosphatidate cytidylyltransferase